PRRQRRLACAWCLPGFFCSMVAGAGAIQMTSDDPGLRFQNNGVNSVADNRIYDIRQVSYSPLLWNYLQFRTVNDANNVFTERLSLSNSGGMHLGSTYSDPGTGNLTIEGNVGIGTTMPAATLQVSSNTNGTPILQVGNAFAPYSLVVSTNGNVGIGIADPGQKLEIAVPDATTAFVVTNTGSSNKQWGWIPRGNNAVIRETGVADVMTFQAGGNVGIGTTAPDDKLDVVGNVQINSGSLYVGKIYDNDNSTYYLDPNAATSALLAGNVGIGTTAPSAKLDLYNAGTGTVLRIGGNSIVTSNAAGLDFYAVNGEAMPAYARIGLGVAGGSVGLETGYLALSTINGGSLTEKARITSGGNVGIGTTAPSTKLDVAGTVSASALVVNGDIQTTSANAFYFGDSATDGTWRIIRSGNNLVFQRRESGVWVDKSMVLP
ncbi:MAG: hypothetical protein AABZ14_03150, partial [Candidatus Margulisiibacteriota bacterium]